MSLASVAVAVIAKFPAAGKVKTRLTPTLSPEQAARVHRAFLLHLFRRLHALKPAELIAYFDPPDAGDAMADLLAEFKPTLIAQCTGDLGRRLAHIATEIGATHARMLILAVDSPDVPTQHLVHAAQLTAHSDVSLGPADDGGYWYLGLRNTVDAAALLHTNIDWSTDCAAAQTLANARSLGYRTATSGTWDDVDRPEDLDRLRARLRSSTDSADRSLFETLEQILR